VIELSHVSRSFTGRNVLDDISLRIRDGEIFALIGPSGSGKTTLLRIIDLLEEPSQGQILFNGSAIGPGAEDRLLARRGIGMVFQKPVPLSTTVFGNVAAGLRFRGMKGDALAGKVREALEVVGISQLADRRARTLSGGEMQRLALARAIATGPGLLLMDEPTANLDPANSALIEELILSINRRFRTTVVIATHDLPQGQRLAHRLGVLDRGHLLQTGEPAEVFYHPGKPEVARFVGVENILPGTVTGSSDGLTTVSLGGAIAISRTELPAGTKVLACIRAEDITLHTSKEIRSSARNLLMGRIIRVASQGPFARVTVDAGISLTALVTTRSVQDLGLSPEKVVSLTFKAGAVHLIPTP
jgi:tungstate transport system ATP-binding protein